MGWWNSEELSDLYVRLIDAGVQFVVVGGQAVNLWSEKYRTTSAEWMELEPFASHDLDFLGGSIDVRCAARSLGVEAEFYDPFSRVPIPNSGSLTVPIGDRELLIHFLHTIVGANRDEVRRTARMLHGIECERAIPIDAIQAAAAQQPKLANFLERRWPAISGGTGARSRKLSRNFLPPAMTLAKF